MQESFIPDCDNYYGLHNSYVMQMVLVLRPEVRAIYPKLLMTYSWTQLKWKNNLS